MLEAHLNDCGVEAKRPVYKPAHHYFTASQESGVTLLEAYPGADRAHERALSLPIHPKLIDEDIAYVIDSVREFFSGETFS